MKFFLKLLVTVHLCLAFSAVAQAKTIVLVHGMLSDETEWFKSGVGTALIKSGYSYKGNLPRSNNKLIQYQNVSHSLSADQPAFYTIKLDWFLSIEEQSFRLAESINQITEHRKEDVTLIGHSLGGVVARHYLIEAEKRNLKVGVEHLITIASPHLGTPWAWMAWQALQTPAKQLLSPISPIPLSRAEQMLFEISSFPQRNLIHRMALEDHPNIRYTSIVHRMDITKGKFDMFVSPDSQNMNKLHALQGKATNYEIAGQHGLSINDAWLIVKILQITA